jgi:hypothetical protein
LDYIETDNEKKYNLQFLLDKFFYSPFFGIKLINNLDKIIIKKKFHILEQDKFEINNKIVFNHCYIKGIATKL